MGLVNVHQIRLSGVCEFQKPGPPATVSVIGLVWPNTSGRINVFVFGIRVFKKVKQGCDLSILSHLLKLETMFDALSADISTFYL